MMKRLGLTMLVLALVAGGLTACGKRGDPYRPSEIPAKSANSGS
ncbi:MAG: LPS translocon maturation chaperone LptM [Candidatus Puniceispirillaceae bacterium]|jgi:predicted small lipoprotein YifL